MCPLWTNQKTRIHLNRQLDVILVSIIHFQITTCDWIFDIFKSQSFCQFNLLIINQRYIYISRISYNFCFYIVHSNTMCIFCCIDISKIVRHIICQKICSICNMRYFFNDTIRNTMLKMINFHNIERV